MTQATCGICGQVPSKHSQDQIRKCFSDAGLETKFTLADALFIAREYRLLKKYSPVGGRGRENQASIWFKSDPETEIKTTDLPDTVFKEALPRLETLEKKDDGGKSSDEEPEEPEEPEDPEDMVFDDETLERMEEDKPFEG